MKSDFCVAVHALVYLNHRGTAVCSEELARNICTNPARVRKVTSQLKTAGLIETKEGSEGGSQLIGDPECLTLEQVRQALQLRVVDTNWLSGDAEKPCLIASGMAGVMQQIMDELDACCREKLKKMTIAQIDRQIFEDHRPETEKKFLDSSRKETTK